MELIKATDPRATGTTKVPLVVITHRMEAVDNPVAMAVVLVVTVAMAVAPVAVGPVVAMAVEEVVVEDTMDIHPTWACPMDHIPNLSQ